MDVKRRSSESTGSLLRRFSRLGQQTKIVANAKKRTSRQKKQTERMEKNRAIMREHLRALRKHLERLGKYDKETFEEEKRKIKRTINL